VGLQESASHGTKGIITSRLGKGGPRARRRSSAGKKSSTSRLVRIYEWGVAIREKASLQWKEADSHLGGHLSCGQVRGGRRAKECQKSSVISVLRPAGGGFKKKHQPQQKAKKSPAFFQEGWQGRGEYRKGELLWGQSQENAYFFKPNKRQ